MLEWIRQEEYAQKIKASSGKDDDSGLGSELHQIGDGDSDSDGDNDNDQECLEGTRLGTATAAVTATTTMIKSA